MRVIKRLGYNEAQLLQPPVHTSTLTGGTVTALDIQDIEIVRFLVSTNGITLSIDDSPASSKAFSLVIGENFYPVLKDQKVCVYGGDVEMNW